MLPVDGEIVASFHTVDFRDRHRADSAVSGSLRIFWTDFDRGMSPESIPLYAALSGRKGLIEFLIARASQLEPIAGTQYKPRVNPLGPKRAMKSIV